MENSVHNLKRAFITGSCEGIGFAMASSLFAAGYQVILHDKQDEDKCLKALTHFGIEPKKNVNYFLADFQSPEAVAGLCEKLPIIDVLILNASTQIRKDFLTINFEEFKEQVFTNYWSSIALIQQVLPAMQQNKWGRIITLGSVQEKKPHPQMAIYAGTKSAIANLVINLAAQYAKDGITINNVSPGVYETARNIEALSNADYAKAILKKIPTGSFGNPADIAALVTLLVSQQGQYITGQTIYCDGGMSL
ncbi:SDR family NAD(P)-dependent oxidoreductase [Sphingobacterium humi]|uniref:SDR family oxidoreductase n=1 Tax=Sphingobacterium humi TaxID=1796905 RepID=A0A6N8KV54_9SPHI|nr:SDR family oxidoreductase [Sphingobacterium humi]MVZ60674.1 SDR family oxidoreductase [Sphingobacterium humi]